MKKNKILFLFLSVLCFFGIFSFEANASEKREAVNTYTNSTSIQDDFKNLGLDLNDYLYRETEYTNKNFCVAVSENMNLNDTYVQSYLYVYNPNGMKTNDLYISISMNDVATDMYTLGGSNGDLKDVSIVSKYSNASHDIVYKIAFNFLDFKKDVVERKYKVNEIVYTTDTKDRIDSLSNFEATFKDDKESDSSDFNFNSITYISNDKVVSVVLNNEYAFLDSNWWKVFFHGEGVPQLLFYNFTTDKKIDKIISVSVSFDEYKTNVVDIPVGSPGLAGDDSVISAGEIVSDQKTIRNRRIDNEKTYKYEWGSTEYDFEYFKVPSSDRFTDNEFQNLEKYVTKKDFTDYQCSILFEIKNVQVTPNGEIQYLYKVENFELGELEYEYEGKIYKSQIVDEDGADEGGGSDTVVTPGGPNKGGSLWDMILETIKEFLDNLSLGFKIVGYIGLGVVVLWVASLVFRLVGFVISIFK